jgi:hypothetical protein
MPRLKLTKSSIDVLPTPPSDVIYWDAAFPGFGVKRRRNATGYDRAVGLLLDLRAVAEERGAMPDFDKRLRAIRERHARKQQFVVRLAKIG